MAGADPPTSKQPDVVGLTLLQILSIAAITLLGLVIRLHAAWIWNGWHPDSPQRLIGDEPGYDNTARELLQGLGFTWPGRVPLYSLWLAAVYALGGGSYHSVPYAQAFLGAAAIPLTYALGRTTAGHGPGLLAALFVALSYVLVHQSFHLLSEVLYTLVVLLATLALAAGLRRPSGIRYAWIGAIIGVCNLVRPALLLFPVALLPVLAARLPLRRAVSYWVVCVVASTVIVAPWLAHNYVRFGALFPLQTSNAILWQGSPEYYHLVRDQGYTYYRIWAEILYGPGWREHDPNSVEGDRYWTARALRSIADEPLVYIRYAAEKTVTYWIGDPNADWADTYPFNYRALRSVGYTRSDAVWYMLARTLPILALLSALLLRYRWRDYLALYLLLGYFTLIHAATHAEVRLSDPLQPLLLVLIGGAVYEGLGLTRRWIERRRDNPASGHGTVPGQPGSERPILR